MNKVPKCKQCQYLHQYTIGKHNYYDCYHPDIWTTGKKVYAKNIKTSPQYKTKYINKVKKIILEEISRYKKSKIK